MSREVKVGDIIYITKISGEKLDVPHEVEVSFIYEGLEMFKITPPIPLPSNSDYLEEFIGMDENSSDEWYFEPPKQSTVYDDDAISPSYSEAVRAGKTFADYTGAHITAKSLDFKTKEDEIIEGITPESLNFREVESDNVNHPSHYNYGDIEVIDFIEQVTQQYEDGFDAYIVGNALKYLARSPHKNGLEDVKKAVWYLNRLIKRNEDE